MAQHRARASSQIAAPYRFHYYPAANAYLAASAQDNHVYFLAGGQLADREPQQVLLTAAGCA